MLNEDHIMLAKPLAGQSCYEYLLQSHDKIKSFVGHDYPAFVNLDCKTMLDDLIADIEKFAAYLTARGFKKGDVFTVFLPTSAHAFTAFYALGKLGLIANFVHPLTPPAGLAKILDFTKSKGIFILDRAAAHYEDIIKNTFTVICSTSDYTSGAIHDAVLADDEANSAVPAGENIHFFRDIMKGEYGSVPTVRDNGRAVAVYLHSSGTTGKAKTVQLSAFALNSVAYNQYPVDVGHDYGESYSLCVLPCFHAFGLGASMHYCLCIAYSCILMPKFDAEKANDYIKRYKVQYISGAPAMFRKMYDAPNFENEGLKNLNVLYSGGDIVSESFLHDFNNTLRRNGSTGNLYRGWGLTEMCAVCATNNAFACKAESIGPALRGLEVCILDEDGEKLPAGEEGEIALRGDMRMEGYLPDPDDPFDGIWYDKDGLDWIRTGDIGKVDEDGFIFFTGRKKRIIVISGYNIYPYSMEQKLMTLPFIREACAVQGYAENGKPLVKLCVSLTQTEKTAEEIKAELVKFCEVNFDRFSVPRKVEIFDALPRTKMDKIDFMTMSDPVPRN